MIHLGRSYPYMEEVNDGILRQFCRMGPGAGSVLDVGCGRAALGEAIGQLGWRVCGIERSEEACLTAQQRLDRLIRADLLDEAAIERELGDAQFDFLIFSDVLEHFYDPLTLLKRFLRYLKPGGTLLISLPNAVAWTNRFLWLLGYAEYTDTGIRDRTHIRYFTFRTARRLVEAAGCRVVKADFTPYLVRPALPLMKRFMAKTSEAAPPNPRALIDSRSYQFYMRWVYPVERVLAGLWKSMFAFRIILVAVKSKSS
jgi:2-polyprenyl-3-methyl-5-hydroxy-6-metoxy-1,4-benzoquinol methylase